MCTYHSLVIDCPMFGKTTVEYCSTIDGADFDIIITDAHVSVPESGAVVALNAALTRTPYSRNALVPLDKRLFPLIRDKAWDDLVEKAREDRDEMRHERPFYEAAE